MLSAVLRARCLSRPLQRSLLSHGSSVQAPLLVRWASVPPTGCAIAAAPPQVRWVFVPCALHFPPRLRVCPKVPIIGLLWRLPLPSLSASRLRWCCHCRRHLPPSRAVCLPNHWHPFSHSAPLSPQLLFSSSQVLLHWVGLFLAAVLHAFELLKYRLLFSLQSPRHCASVESSCEASRPFGASPPLCPGSA